VVGLPDDKWGQSVNAVVSLHNGYELDEIALRDFTRKTLAGYKLPKRILAKDDLERAPNGKANYKLIREYAARELSVEI
jgi:fatty-acyl-CoA synthase